MVHAADAQSSLSQQLQSCLQNTLQLSQRAVSVLSREVTSDSTAASTSTSWDLNAIVDRKRLSMYRRAGESLRTIHEALSALDGHVESMQASADIVDSCIHRFRQSSSRLLTDAQMLSVQREELEVHKVIVDALLDKFSLSGPELQAIDDSADDTASTASPGGVSSDLLSPAFFAAFNRLLQVQADCRTLLHSIQQHSSPDSPSASTGSGGGGGGFSSVAVHDIVQVTDRHLDTAYSRLFAAARRALKAFTRDSPDISVVVCDIIRSLRHRPLLFRELVEDITLTRRSTVGRCFNSALVHGVAHEGLAPIELHSHDPVRFVGDMLAWVHQAACGEREMAERLLIADDSTIEGAVPVTSAGVGVDESWSVAETQALITTLLDRIFEGICRPLRIRVDQVFAQLESVAEAYRIANIIQFYTSMLERVILNRKVGSQVTTPSGSDQDLSNSPVIVSRPQLVKYLDDLTQSAFKVFYDILNQRASALLQQVEEPAADLSPPELLTESIVELKALMANYDSALILPLVPALGVVDISGSSPASSTLGGRAFVSTKNRASGFDTVLNLFVDPLLQMCISSGERLSTPFMRSIFVLNCVTVLVGALNMYVSFTKRRCELLEAHLEVHQETVVDEEFRRMLSRSGIASMYSHIQMRSIQKDMPPMSRVLEFEGSKVHRILAGPFDTYLCSISLEVSSDLAPIVSPKLADVVAKRCIGKFLGAYREIADAILDPKNLYEFPMTNVLVRTLEEVETVVGVHQ
eukprot:Partr_v1_DN27240_c1_g1_i4_m39020 putative Component of oligomeric Golgi complex 6